MDGTSTSSGERIAKRLARAGICSRRDAERLIEQGRVKVDGKTIETPATLVTEANRIEVDGQAVAAPQRPRIWLFHKPPGLVVTARDPEGRPTVFDNLPHDLPRVISIGRLDIASEGLLLLTNDGAGAAHGAAGDRPRSPLSRARAWPGRSGDARSPVGGRHDRRRALRPDPRPARTPAAQQQLDHRHPARRQEPRGAPGDGASRAGGEPADSHRLRPLQPRRAARGRGGRGQRAAGRSGDGRRRLRCRWREARLGAARTQAHSYGRHKPPKDGEPAPAPNKPESWRGPTRPRRTLAVQARDKR